MLGFPRRQEKAQSAELIITSPHVLLPEPSLIPLDQAVHTALLLSSSFESPDGFGSVVGNFDGEGLTCGALGFAWKYGRQQSLILKCEAKYPGTIRQMMPNHGDLFLTLAKMPVSRSFVQIANFTNSSGVVDRSIKFELTQYWGSREMTEMQVEEAMFMGQHALVDATQWAISSRQSTEPTLQEFVFMFDVTVQNGSLNGLSFDSIKTVMSENLDQNFQKIVNYCDVNSNRDCKKNAIIWQKLFETASENQKNLLSIGYLRSLKARQQYAGAVLNRRGTIALMQGYVNQTLRDFYLEYPHLLNDTVR